MARTPGKLVLEPLVKPHNMTRAVFERLAAEIRSRKLPAGARLPTEQEMMVAMGVSRTVIREAVAALRAEGLVVTRQGSGAFVSADDQRRPFRIDSESFAKIDEVIDVLELRLSVEVEAAALAAERGSPTQLRAIAAALAGIDRAIDRDKGAIDEDFALHRAIAAATGNGQFVRFLDYLGRVIIPRQSIRVEPGRVDSQRAYLMKIQGEHRAIVDAIAGRNPAAAREAMRRHLSNGRDRYRQLANR